MRGRKRLRKKLQQRKEEKVSKIIVQLDCCSELKTPLCSNLIERFQQECLNPIGLRFQGKSTESGWSGTVNPLEKTPLTEQHRENIADWLFQQQGICSYAVGHLSA